MVQVYKATDIGLVRQVNEDSLATIEPDTYIVADGMGGHVAGEVASHILVETAHTILDSDVTYSEKLLQTVVLRANNAILDAIRSHPEYAGMGTTATIFHREGNIGIWAHVGDSRIYLLRHGMLQQLTRDHSLVSDLVANGSITPEEARIHPQRNVLMRAVGVEEELLVDTGQLELFPGDCLLLCTDGLTNMVTNEEIREILLQENHEDKAAVLIRKALAGGGRDNVTAIVVQYDA